MNRTAKQFEGLLARYFETLLHDHPTFSTICAGLRDGEGKLGRLTLDFHKKRERETAIHAAGAGGHFAARADGRAAA